MFIPLQATPNAGGGAGSFWLMLLLLFAIMYFFMIRPQNKKQKEINNFRRALQVGQNVVTAGGVFGVVKEIGDTYVIVEVDRSVRIKVDKNSIFAAPSDNQTAATK